MTWRWTAGGLLAVLCSASFAIAGFGVRAISSNAEMVRINSERIQKLETTLELELRHISEQLKEIKEKMCDGD